jgi:Protein of unknown function (DUF1580)
MTDTPSTPPVIREILAGDHLTLTQAARKLPPHRGNAVAPSTLWRWHFKGLGTPDGRRVHLELARVGGKWLTSLAALTRFITASTPTTATEAVHTPRSRTDQQRERATERASRELEKLGI